MLPEMVPGTFFCGGVGKLREKCADPATVRSILFAEIALGVRPSRSVHTVWASGLA
jgi:hypothetical protein